MQLLSFVKEAIKKADFFQTKELLRYKAHTDYRSVFGGTISLLLMLLLLILFYYRFFACLQKESITSTQEKLIRETPSPYTIKTYPEGNFMFAISIQSFSLTDEKRFVNVYMESIQLFWDYDLLTYNKTLTQINLERCTRQHWKLMPRMDKQYDSWQFDDLLCPPMGSLFQLEGDQFSDVSKYLQIRVQPCTNDSFFSTPCASKHDINSVFRSTQNIETRLYIVNPNVNPTTTNYLQYHFNYGNILTFTTQLGSYGKVYVEDFQIETDESIIPIEMKRTQIGATFSTTTYQKTFNRVRNDDYYCQFSIFKSPVSKRYQREFEKFDQLLAFIGGIFNTLSMMLIFVSSYNNFAYQICLGSSLFKPQDEKQLKTFKKYNFISYLFQITYKFLNFFGCSPNWKTTMEYEKCQRQMEKQLDVQYILDRLSFLQSATSSLLEDHQRKGIHLKGKLTLKEAKNRRKNFKLKNGIKEVRRTIQHQISCDFTNLNMQFRNNPSADGKNEVVFAPTPKPAPKRISLFTNNKVSPTFEINQKNIMHFEKNSEQSSQSSSDDEQFTQKSGDSNENEVLDILDRLKEESECGNKLSERIWSATNEVLKHVLPDLLKEDNDQESISDFNNDSQNPKSIQPLIMNNELEAQDRQINEIQTQVSRAPKINSPRQRLSRFSKMTQSSANRVKDIIESKKAEKGKT